MCMCVAIWSINIEAHVVFSIAPSVPTTTVHSSNFVDYFSAGMSKHRRLHKVLFKTRVDSLMIEVLATGFWTNPAFSHTFFQPRKKVELECHDGHPSDLWNPSRVFQQEVTVVQSITGKVLLSCTKWQGMTRQSGHASFFDVFWLVATW